MGGDDKFEEKFMARALALAFEKMNENDGGPFGAVIVRNGAILSEGWNRVTSANDPTGHAEISAIRDACQKLGTFNLPDCDIYTSCEPCPMCLGAIYWARLRHIYYANTRAEAAAIGFDDAFIYDEMPKPPGERAIRMEHRPTPEAAAAFAAWMAKADKITY